MWIRTLDDRLINCDKVKEFEIDQYQQTKETKPNGQGYFKSSVLEVASKIAAEIDDDRYKVVSCTEKLVLTDDEEADKKALQELYKSEYEVMEFVVDKICAALLNRQAVLDMNDVKAELISRKKESKDGTGTKDEAAD